MTYLQTTYNSNFLAKRCLLTPDGSKVQNKPFLLKPQGQGYVVSVRGEKNDSK